ncbi:MAG: hypothetical protein ACK4SO_08505 [Candidatus Kapaibacteriota bacterium]
MFLFLILPLFVGCREYSSFKLSEIEVKRLEIAKPRSIFYSIYDSAFYICTNDGMIAKCDTNFSVLTPRKLNQANTSHIFVDELFVYVITSKDLLKLDKSHFELKFQIPLSKLNLLGFKLLGFYLNPVTKTFDFVLDRKGLKILQLDPINFKRTKIITMKKSYKASVCFLYRKYLYLIDNNTSSVDILDISKSFEFVKSYKFSAPEISSGSFLPPNIIVLLSMQTRRVFYFSLE